MRESAHLKPVTDWIDSPPKLSLGLLCRWRGICLFHSHDFARPHRILSDVALLQQRWSPVPRCALKSGGAMGSFASGSRSSGSFLAFPYWPHHPSVRFRLGAPDSVPGPVPEQRSEHFPIVALRSKKAAAACSQL